MGKKWNKKMLLPLKNKFWLEVKKTQKQRAHSIQYLVWPVNLLYMHKHAFITPFLNKQKIATLQLYTVMHDYCRNDSNAGQFPKDNDNKRF